MSFATKGDVSMNAVHIVEFPNDAFHQTVDILMLTVQALINTLAQNQDVKHLGPFAVGQADVEVI
jgi:hypothetical protein